MSSHCEWRFGGGCGSWSLDGGYGRDGYGGRGSGGFHGNVGWWSIEAPAADAGMSSLRM